MISIFRFVTGRRFCGTLISASPRRYFAVSDVSLFRRPAKLPSKHEIAAKFAGMDADVDNVIGGAHRFFVVLDDEHRVADVAQVFEDLDQPGIVARMQADARLVENVKRADEQRAEICRELYPLSLAAGKRRRETAERQVIEADLDEEF